MKVLSCIPRFDKKINETNIKNLGFANPFSSPEIQQKIIDTNIQIYGCSYSSQNQEVKEKTKNTNMKIYGCECSLQNPEVHEKTKNTNMQIFGCEYPSQNAEIKKKTKNTNMKLYGVECALQNPEVHEKSINTSMIKYGFPHPMQNAEVAERVSKAAYKLKEYLFPSGRMEHIQGYENKALDDLLFDEQICENEIITKRTEVPEVWWTDDTGKKHRYYVDILIVNEKRCIEVKSTWTFEKKKDIVFLKQQAVKDLGFKCEIWVYDNKKLVEKYY